MPIPPIVYGTAWKKERTAALVSTALRLGFRGVDTACQPKHYDEPGVGEGVATAVDRGILRRDELYLQTKFTPLGGQDPAQLPYPARAALEDQVRQSCETSLRNLRTDYLDGLILHSPLRSFDQTLRAWHALEECVQQGWAQRIGLSNCYDPSLFEAIWRAARVKPAILQNRLYADTEYDVTLRAFCGRHSVCYQSFWTLTANPRVLSHPVLEELATRYDATREQVFLRCLTQSSVVPLVGTTSETHMRQDLALFDFELRPADVAALTELLTVGT